MQRVDPNKPYIFKYNDYRKITAKFKSNCDGCREQINKGDVIAYASVGKRAYRKTSTRCMNCWKEWQREIENEGMLDCGSW